MIEEALLFKATASFFYKNVSLADMLCSTGLGVLK